MPNKTNTNAQVQNVQYEIDRSDAFFPQELQGHTNTHSGDTLDFVSQFRGYSTVGSQVFDVNQHFVQRGNHVGQGGNVTQSVDGEQVGTQHFSFNANDQGSNSVGHTRYGDYNEVTHFNTHSPNDFLI